MPLITEKSASKKLRRKRAKVSPAARVARKMLVRQVPGTVSEERLFRPDGHRERVLTLDANSATFTSDLTLMFEKNVARARRGHKRKADSPGRGD